MYLWHGTSPDVAEIIAMKEGFDERLANAQGLFGAGVYGAEQFCKSDHYVTATATGERHMFLCRFLLGNPHYPEKYMVL